MVSRNIVLHVSKDRINYKFSDRRIHNVPSFRSSCEEATEEKVKKKVIPQDRPRYANQFPVDLVRDGVKM